MEHKGGPETKVTKTSSLKPIPAKQAVLLLGGPLLFILAGLLGVFLVKGAGAVGFMLTAAVGSILTGAGKFVVLAGVHADAPIGPLGLAALVICMDTTAAFMLIPIMPLVYRMPLLGKYLRQVQNASYMVLQRNRWMRRFTFVGLVGYVAVPLGGTGAVGAVFLGRLLGLGRVSIVAGTFVGAVIGAVMIFGLASLGQEYVDLVENNPWFTYAGIGVMILAGGLIVWRFVAAVRNGKKQDSSELDFERDLFAEDRSSPEKS